MSIIEKLTEGIMKRDVQKEGQLLKDQIIVKKDKVFTFHLMLQQYSMLLQRWSQLLNNSTMKFTEKSRNDYLKSLSNRTDQPKQLLTDASFNVNSVIIGNTVLSSRQSKISTHEEFFTFCHQSLLAILASFSFCLAIALACSA